MSDHFNIVILGAGPGGYVAALKAAQLGAKVAVVEKSNLGGTCLNYGCIPSKTLLASAELLYQIKRAASLGIEVSGEVKFNWTKIQSRKNKALQALRTGIQTLFTARQVTVLQGQAVLNGLGKVAIHDGSRTAEITADKIILAVGSAPTRIPDWPSDLEFICTSDEALHWKTLPKKLLIIGGGVIGCEFACMMQPFGVEVAIVEMLPNLLPNLDAQIATTLEKIFTRRGIECFTGTKIENLTKTDSGIKATLSNGRMIEADRALVAIGRQPNTAALGLESVGLKTERGFVRVNDQMETPVKDYYCIGDANGRCLLAHAASAQGVVAVENALGAVRSFSAPMPNCVYTFPEIGAIGMTAEEARAKEIPISIGVFPIGHLGKAIAVGDTEGFVKIIRHRETDQLLGAHILGHNATECIAAAGALLHQKVSTQEVAEVVFAHPTISEAIKEAADDALSKALHLPPRKIARVTV
ncbi:MAG: dihydrolipoyl dehydrogenase [Planctomycetota bacterium]